MVDTLVESASNVEVWAFLRQTLIAFRYLVFYVFFFFHIAASLPFLSGFYYAVEQLILKYFDMFLKLKDLTGSAAFQVSLILGKIFFFLHLNQNFFFSSILVNIVIRFIGIRNH